MKKSNISVSNAKDIIDNFLGLDNKYGWVRFEFMVDTGTDAKNIFLGGRSYADCRYAYKRLDLLYFREFKI